MPTGISSAFSREKHPQNASGRSILGSRMFALAAIERALTTGKPMPRRIVENWLETVMPNKRMAILIAAHDNSLITTDDFRSIEKQLGEQGK